MKKPPIELRKLKPATASARLRHVTSLVRGSKTSLRDTVLGAVCLDDVRDTEEGKALMKQLWVAFHKLDGVALWLAKLAKDAESIEVRLRDKKKLDAWGVKPEEVLNREP